MAGSILHKQDGWRGNADRLHSAACRGEDHPSDDRRNPLGQWQPYAWRVLLAAELKGVPYESHLLSFQAKDHKAPAFLAMNPRGKVPVLKDGGRVVTESMAIMHYIDGLATGPSLFGDSIDERTAVWEWTSRVIYELEDPVNAFARPLVFGKPGDDVPGEVAAALPKLQAELEQFEAGLAGRDWLCGGAGPSAADLAAFPTSSSSSARSASRRPRRSTCRCCPGLRTIPTSAPGSRASRPCPATSGPIRRTGARADLAGAAVPRSGTRRHPR